MGKVVTIPYKPHQKQLELHEDNHRYKVIVCGRRFGKTMFAVNETIKKSMQRRGLYWYIAPSYKQAKKIAWEMFKHYAVTEIRTKKPNESELTIDLINTSKIVLIGADSPENLRGVGLCGVVFDEFADIRRNVWETIVRPMLTESKGWAIFQGTPKGKLNILYEHYIRDVEKNDKEFRSIDNDPIFPDEDYKSWKFVSADNPYLDRAEIEKARREMSPQLFAQEFEASFENYIGRIYKEYQDRHNIGVELKPYWNYYLGIDTGRYTSVSFIATDEEKKAYVFDEIYDFDGIVKDICDSIKYKMRLYNIRPKFIIIDSASQVKREYSANGIYTQDSYKDIDNSIALIRNMFFQNRLFFDRDKCKMHIVEHKGYVWDDKKSKPVPLDENDHSCNSLQYILNGIFLSKVETPEQKEYKKSLEYALIQSGKKSNNANRVMS